MVYRSVWDQPPRGSTAWGARQFSRVLDEEERIAAERERLLAMGWQPPHTALGTSDSRPFSEEPVFGDERDAYADLIERDLAFRRTLDGEAQQRVSTTAPGWVGGGRFGIPVPANSMPGGGNALYQQVGAKDDIIKLIAALLAQLGMAEVARQSTDQGSSPDETLLDFGFGSSEREITPPLPPQSPFGGDPIGPKNQPRPLPGFPGTSGELGEYDRFGTPLPPPSAAKPDVPKPAPLPEELKPYVIPNGLPEILGKFWQAGILIRAESASTRQDNEDIIQMVKDQMEACGWAAEHTHGALEKERYFEGHGPGTAGSRYTDGTVAGAHPDGRKALYDFNTARQLKDGRWVAYERRAASAISLLKAKVDELRGRFDVYPKSRGMDRETWRESVRPYVQEAVRALLNC